MMDLRVSVEKAKQLRQKAKEAKEAVYADAPEKALKRPDNRWNAPTYCDSRCVELDIKKVLKNRCVCLSPDAPELGHYKLLRTRIQHRCQAHGWNTVMITSAVPGEGKTLTAVNLALTFAMAYNQTALLVDCDLRRQTIHRYLGLSNEKGLADFLENGTELKDLIVWPGVEKLTVISGGKPVHDSAELVSSPRMAALVAEMKSRYADRYIFFDVPPLLAEADALAFAPLVDCILMVVQPQTPFQAIEKALELVPKEKFLGFALNGVKSSENGYHYYTYGYGRY
jgi:protein-tyrosine kinase